MQKPPNDNSVIGDAQFPRTDDLPLQSPKYWVSQKDRYLRQLMIRDIERLTGRRLLVYFANRFADHSGIEAGDLSFFVELLSDLEADEKVDILVETNGGVTDATEAIVSLVKNRCSDFRAIVANGAKSNGTLICLAARSIVMGPSSELGPIDPHLQGTPCTILAGQHFAQINYPLHELAKLALKQTQKLGEFLLADGMMAGKPADEIQKIVKSLGTRDVYFSHGSAIDAREAKALGLVIDELAHDDPIWQRLWLLYTMYDFDCQRDALLKVFESSSRSTAVVENNQNPSNNTV